jgi:hypothetical protein
MRSDVRPIGVKERKQYTTIGLRVVIISPLPVTLRNGASVIDGCTLGVVLALEAGLVFHGSVVSRGQGYVDSCMPGLIRYAMRC